MIFQGIQASEIAGFIGAQNQLRQDAGVIATFGVPTDPAWPDGTAINPDTNLPYDATVVQTNAEYLTTDVTVLVVEKQASPLRPQADPSFSESGLRDGMDIILDVSVADFEATVQHASMFTVLGEDFTIEESKPFGIAAQIYRYLVYGAQK